MLEKAMRRRDFIIGIAGSAAILPLEVQAQQAAIPLIGWLDFEAPGAARVAIPAFLRGLADTGYVEGRTVLVEYRWAEGHHDRLPELAADLVRREATVIVASTTASAFAAKVATQTIPVVFRIGSDPVEIGLVASLNRPSGNITGITNLSAEITAKRLALLHDLLPAATSIGLLVNPANSNYAQAETRDLQSATDTLGVRVLVINAGTETDVAAAFATAVEQQVGALLLGADTYFFSVRDQIIQLAVRNAIPTMFFDSASVAAGGLLSYGSDLTDANYQAGIYVGKILKGAKPADLPVMQSAKFELAINMKTAKALGLVVPPTLLASADKVIE